MIEEAFYRQFPYLITVGNQTKEVDFSFFISPFCGKFGKLSKSLKKDLTKDYLSTVFGSQKFRVLFKKHLILYEQDLEQGKVSKKFFDFEIKKGISLFKRLELVSEDELLVIVKRRENNHRTTISGLNFTTVA